MGSTLDTTKIIKMVKPRLPEAAKRAGVKGLVLLQVTIDERGNVTEVQALRGHPLLNSAAEEAVKQWKYEPFLFRGYPLAYKTTVTVNFPDK